MTRDTLCALAAAVTVSALTVAVAFTEPPSTPAGCERHGGTPRQGTVIVRLRPAPYMYCERTPR